MLSDLRSEAIASVIAYAVRPLAARSWRLITAIPMRLRKVRQAVVKWPARLLIWRIKRLATLTATDVPVRSSGRNPTLVVSYPSGQIRRYYTDLALYKAARDHNALPKKPPTVLRRKTRDDLKTLLQELQEATKGVWPKPRPLRSFADARCQNYSNTQPPVW